jgi:hypothetical protein
MPLPRSIRPRLTLFTLDSPLPHVSCGVPATVSGRRQLGRRLTIGASSGSGFMDTTDITYVTPAAWLLQDIANHGIHKPNVTPALTLIV